ncbi:MAG: MarR family transcriptional regulator [Blastopirellula sp.]|nr:MAG: MarR family transcriptional regulator [Blastopirellula sp.]
MTKKKNIPSNSEQHLGEMGLENFPPYLMNRIMGRYNASLKKELLSLGLTTPQMRSLAVLSVINGILISELAVYAVVPQSTLSRALDVLEANGFIYRDVDEADTRAVHIFLTSAGSEANDRLWPHMSQANDAMFEGIDVAEKQAVVSTLKKMLRNIRKHKF